MARIFGGFGALPDFSAGGDPLLSSYVSQLGSAIQQAQQTQATVAPLLTRPEGSSLAAVISGLEGSIANSWAKLRDLCARVTQAQQAQDAAAATPRPSQSSYQYPNGIYDWQRATDQWTQGVNAMLANVTAAKNNATVGRDELASLLGQYNSKVPPAATLVQAVVDAGLKAQAAHADVGTATDARTAATLQTQAFVAEQQLAQVQKQAAAAAAGVASGGPSPLIIAAVAIPVLGVIAYALTRKKSSSVAGYRRRKSRRSRQ